MEQRQFVIRLIRLVFRYTPKTKNGKLCSKTLFTIVLLAKITRRLACCFKCLDACAQCLIANKVRATMRGIVCATKAFVAAEQTLMKTH